MTPAADDELKAKCMIYRDFVESEVHNSRSLFNLRLSKRLVRVLFQTQL